MATVVNGSQVKLNDGKVVQAQQGGWYDGQQFWGGTLSAPGVINSQSNQIGAGQAVSKEVVQQTNPANWDYIQKQQQAYKGVIGGDNPAMSTSGSDLGSLGMGVPTAEAINLPQLYESFYQQSGIRDQEAEFAKKTEEYNNAVAKIKDNPYLSEATMTGRIKKIQDKYDMDKNAFDNQIATKKADIETKLNLESKQFDINSQVARDALDRFNTLLGAGALDNASAGDIANLTRATGLSSQAIQSAVNAQKKKNANTQVITSTNDAGEVTAVVIDQNTGEIISKTSLGNIGNAEKGSGGSSDSQTRNQSSIAYLEANKNSYGHVSPAVWNQILNAYIASGGDASSFRANFSQYANPYASDYSKYGLAE